MTHHQTAIRIGGLGAVALAFLLSGCSGNTPAGSTPAGQGVLPDGQTVVPGVARLNLGDEDSSGVATPDIRHRRHNCPAVTNSQSFNGTAIAAGSWIWFTSVGKFPGNSGALRTAMRDSVITFSVGSTTYRIKGPNMRIALGSSGVSLLFKKAGRHRKGLGHWRLQAPANTSGNDLLDTIAYQVPSDLPGGITNVTWSAKFHSEATVKTLSWQWGAAVYTSFTGKYPTIGVKPLDDQKYPPYNSDLAGTPENYKAYLTAGATGGGGANYTGGYSSTVTVTPCH